ncbi:unnamed protein product, partial [Musa hybrid cultivar]
RGQNTHLLFRPLSRRVFLIDHSYRFGFLVRDHIGAVDLRFRSFEVLFVPLLCTSSSSTNSERVLCESRSLFSLMMRHGNGKFSESCIITLPGPQSFLRAIGFRRGDSFFRRSKTEP